jgi:hypothetical protein
MRFIIAQDQFIQFIGGFRLLRWESPNRNRLEKFRNISGNFCATFSVVPIVPINRNDSQKMQEFEELLLSR